MKKDIEWLKKEITDVIDYYYEYPFINGHTQGMINEIKKVMEQADEPEVLSQEWIDTHKKHGRVSSGIFGDSGLFSDYVLVKDLEKEALLVPKQERVEEGRVRLIVGFDGGTESYYATDIGDALDFLTDYDARFTVSKEPIIPKFVADYIQEGHELGVDLGTAMTIETDRLNDIKKYIRENEELFARAWLDGYTVKKEPMYVIKLDDESYLQRYEIDNKNIVTPFRIVGHLKEVAIKFDNKGRAEKVAELVEGKVEELEE